MNSSQVPTTNWWSTLKHSAQSLLGLSSQLQSGITAKPALECSISALSPFLPSHATINSAVPIPANGTWSQPSPLFPNPATGLPALCAITVNVISSPTSSFNFGLFLPNEWNLRFMGSGNGGFGGGINWNDMSTHVLSGFASMSTDTGHTSAVFDASWALNNPETQIDWGHRALHLSVQLSKSLTRRYYSRKIAYSYFSACSTGGRQALKSIQKYPQDFDGVVAAAPAWWTSRLQPWHLAVSLWNLPVDASHHIPGALFEVIGKEVMRQCDPQDGVLDRIISNPQGCVFQPETLLCTPKSVKGECLTTPQLSTLDKMQRAWTDSNSNLLFPALSLGSEFEFGSFMNVDSGYPSPAGTTWLSNFLLNHSKTEASTFGWSSPENFNLSTVHFGDSLNPGEANADQFDLTPFFSRGGKIIHYHGYSDGLIPSSSSLYFHQQVLRTMPSPITSFYKLYLIPSLQHCCRSVNDAAWYINGGGQASFLSGLGRAIKSVPGFEDERHDVIKALMKWVEDGIAPEEIVATKWVDDDVGKEVKSQRPICAYPKMARWDGVGDVEREESWGCVGLY